MICMRDTEDVDSMDKRAKALSAPSMPSYVIEIEGLSHS